MSNKANQAVFPLNQINLLFPEIERMLIENMEKRVILSGSKRQLEYLINEIRENCAAASPLWIQVGDIGNRHVIFESESSEPVRIAIQGTSTKPARPELFAVIINLLGPPTKLALVAE